MAAAAATELASAASLVDLASDVFAPSLCQRRRLLAAWQIRPRRRGGCKKRNKSAAPLLEVASRCRDSSRCASVRCAATGASGSPASVSCPRVGCSDGTAASDGGAREGVCESTATAVHNHEDNDCVTPESGNEHSAKAQAHRA